MVGRPFRRSGSGREALPEFRVALPEVREWSVGPPEGPGVVGSLSIRSSSDRKALPEVQKWLGDPPGGPAVVGRPSRRFGGGRESLYKVRQ